MCQGDQTFLIADILKWCNFKKNGGVGQHYLIILYLTNRKNGI